MLYDVNLKRATACRWVGSPNRIRRFRCVECGADRFALAEVLRTSSCRRRCKVRSAHSASTAGRHRFRRRLWRHGRGDFSGLNLAQLVSAPKLPAGTISGQYQVDAAGPTAADIKGIANLEIESTVIDGVRVYPANAKLAFADGRMRIVDTLNVRTAAARVSAYGAIGLPGGRGDSVLHFTAIVDSLGGLRRYLAKANEPDSAAADSLTGYIEVRGTLGERSTS
jgi:hypothetical protein